MNIEIDLHNPPIHLQRAISSFMYEYYLYKRESEEMYQELGDVYDFELFFLLKYSRMLEMGEYAKEKYNMNFKAHWGYKVETSYGIKNLDSNITEEIDKHYHVENPDYAKVENLIKAYLPELKKRVTPEMISVVMGFDDLNSRIDVENKIISLWQKEEK